MNLLNISLLSIAGAITLTALPFSPKKGPMQLYVFSKFAVLLLLTPNAIDCAHQKYQEYTASRKKTNSPKEIKHFETQQQGTDEQRIISISLIMPVFATAVYTLAWELWRTEIANYIGGHTLAAHIFWFVFFMPILAGATKKYLTYRKKYGN